MTALWAPVFEAYRLDADMAVAMSGRWQEARTLPLNLVRALSVCVGVKPAEEHAAIISQALAVDSAVSRAFVDDLVRRGCLLIAESLLPPRSGASDARITTVAIVTADRPQMLRRCLESYLPALRRHGRRLRLLVADGSRAAAAAAQNRELSLRVSRGDVLVDYRGPAELQQCAPSVPSVWHGCAPWDDIVRADTFTGGSIRNSVMLLTAGECVLMVDDDTLCDLWRGEGASDVVAAAGHYDPRVTAHFETRQAALEKCTWVDDDLLAHHERLLGMRATEQMDLSQACPHLLEAVARDAATVRVTMAGVAGDRAEYCPYNVLFRPGLARHLASAEPGFLAAALTSREATKVAASYAVTDIPVCLTMCTAVDNRTLTPPFIPSGRSEDGLFAEVLRLIDAPTLFGHVPVGIVHDSTRHSEYCAGEILSASETRLADTIRLLASGWRGGAGAAAVEDRLRGLGTHLLQGSRQRSADFRVAVTRSIVETRCQWLQEAERVPVADVCRAEWDSAIARYRSALAHHVTRRDFCVPVEIAANDCPDAGIERLQQCVARFGQMLIEWPQVWETARIASARASVAQTT